jgi:hypothetical protein
MGMDTAGNIDDGLSSLLSRYRSHTRDESR